MSSLSFDSIAPVYDATRGYPDAVAQKIAFGIEHTVHATPQTHFLEVGIGTGRIAFPLSSLGHLYTGVDISTKMVALLEEKLREDGWREQQAPWSILSDEDGTHPSIVHRFLNEHKRASMRLVISDMTALPFLNASFDVVVAVHVFHLISNWQQALQEILRVLRPGGYFIHGWDEHMVSDVRRVEEEWPKILQAMGGEINRPGVPARFVSDLLRAQDFQLEESVLAEWESVVTPHQVVEHVTKRIWSSTLAVPDDIFAASAEKLWQWANEYYGARIDVQQKQGRRFVISKIRK